MDSLWFRMLLGSLALSCGERADVESPKAPGPATTPMQRESRAPAALSTEVPSASAPTRLPEPTAASLATEEEPRIVLAAGGDVNLGRECGQAILKDAAYDPFGNLSEAWRSADARFVNLESQLSDQHGVTQSPEHRLIFTGPPSGADMLVATGVSLVSTANNHAWDYGKSALFETIANLERVELPFAGTGRDLEHAYAPAVLHVKGRSIAVFAVTQVWNQPPFATHEGKDFVAWADIDKLRAGVERARREHDFVLVSYHGGEEYIDAPIDRTRRFMKEIMALGVDAVIGHHPHVPQGIGWAQGRPLLYSLGNFVFAGHDERPWTKLGFFVRLVLQKGSAPELSACPFVIEGHRPRSLDALNDAAIIERVRLHLIGTSTSTGGSNVGPPDEHGCLRVTEKPRRQPATLSSSN